MMSDVFSVSMTEKLENNWFMSLEFQTMAAQGCLYT